LTYLAWFAAVAEGRIGVEKLDPHACPAPISRTVEALHRGGNDKPGARGLPSETPVRMATTHDNAIALPK
jgi:hypothetical protein